MLVLPPTGCPKSSPSRLGMAERYTGQTHGSTKLPPVQGTRVIFGKSMPQPIIRNTREPSPGYRTEVPAEFKQKAKTMLFTEQMKSLADLLASGDDREADEIVRDADQAALQRVAGTLGLGRSPVSLPPRSRLIVSGNRRPKHQTANEVIRREELSATDRGLQRLDAEDWEKFGERETLVPHVIEYPEPQHHDGIYRGDDEDTYRVLDGHLSIQEWQLLPMQFSQNGLVTESELPRAPDNSKPTTRMEVVGNCVSEVAIPKAQPIVPADNPYAKQRLVQFQTALARGKITAVEVEDFCCDAGLPPPRIPFGRN